MRFFCHLLSAKHRFPFYVKQTNTHTHTHTNKQTKTKIRLISHRVSIFSVSKYIVVFKQLPAFGIDCCFSVVCKDVPVNDGSGADTSGDLLPQIFYHPFSELDLNCE